MQEEKSKNKRIKRIVIAIMLLIIAALAIMIFLNADAIFPPEDSTASAVDETAAFTYEAGSRQTFSLAGEGLAVASSSTTQLFDASGKSVFKRIVSFENPAICANKLGALFFDIGSENAYFSNLKGETLELEPKGDIISAALSDSGKLALVTDEAGYKSLVTIYDETGEPLYEWHSGSGYVVDVAFCPDDKHFAVLTITAQGSETHIFAFSSETEKAGMKYENVLLFDIRFTDSERLCAIGEEGIYFSDLKGEELGGFFFEGKYLCGYSFESSDFTALMLSDYRSGTGGTIYTLASDGAIIAELYSERDVTSLSAQGKSLLVMTSAGLELYSRELELQKDSRSLMTASRALLRPGGDVLLASSFCAEKFKF